MSAKNQPPTRSVNFVSGLVLGSLAAAGATFLYKTRPGRKVRRQLKRHFEEAKINLGELVAAIKSEAELAGQATSRQDLKQAKRRLTKPKRTKPKPKKKVFFKAGRPLVK